MIGVLLTHAILRFERVCNKIMWSAWCMLRCLIRFSTGLTSILDSVSFAMWEIDIMGPLRIACEFWWEGKWCIIGWRGESDVRWGFLYNFFSYLWIVERFVMSSYIFCKLTIVLIVFKGILIIKIKIFETNFTILLNSSTFGGNGLGEFWIQ